MDISWTFNEQSMNIGTLEGDRSHHPVASQGRASDDNDDNEPRRGAPGSSRSTSPPGGVSPERYQVGVS